MDLVDVDVYTLSQSGGLTASHTLGHKEKHDREWIWKSDTGSCLAFQGVTDDSGELLAAGQPVFGRQASAQHR